MFLAMLYFYDSDGFFFLLGFHSSLARYLHVKLMLFLKLWWRTRRYFFIHRVIFSSSSFVLCGFHMVLSLLLISFVGSNFILQLMDLLFSFLEPNRPHSVLLAGYFGKVSLLTNKKYV